MIVCPAQKVEATPGYDGSSECLLNGEHGPAQGAVSWSNCIKCSHNKGFKHGKATIKCGYGKNVVTLESIPV